MAAKVHAAGPDIAPRIRMMSACAQVLGICFLLLAFLTLVNFPLEPYPGMLDGRVEIPAELVQAWQAAHLPIQSGVSGFGENWMPARTFGIFTGIVFLTAALSAARGHWIVFFAMLAAMAVPSALFCGEVGLIIPAQIPAVIAIVRCLWKREWRRLVFVAAACGAVLLSHAFVGKPANDAAGNGSYRTDNSSAREEAVSISALMSAVSNAEPAKRAAAAYVRAQLAYIDEDKASLKEMLPAAEAKGFKASPHTRIRLAIMRDAIAERPSSHLLYHVLDLSAVACLILTVVMAFIVWRMRRREKRMVRLKTKLAEFAAVMA